MVRGIGHRCGVKMPAIFTCPVGFGIASIILFCALTALLLTQSSGMTPQDSVVVYTSRDQLYAEPILKAFERDSGIRVRAVYDTGSTKTAGLANRLLAEKDYPQADVFWNSEVVRTIVLKHRGVLAPYTSSQAQDIPARFKDPEGYWTGFAARGRVLIYNTNQIEPYGLPGSMIDLVQPIWKGRVALGTPVLGTMATHHAALFLALGDDAARRFFRGWKDNQVQIVVGNTAVRDAVGRGQIPAGLIDTSDAHEAVSAGLPVSYNYLDQQGMGTLVIPNSVALIAKGPNPTQGQRLIDYMLRLEIEQELARSVSAQIPVRDSVPVPAGVRRLSEIRTMPVDFEQVALRLDEVCTFLNELFTQ